MTRASRRRLALALSSAVVTLAGCGGTVGTGTSAPAKPGYVQQYAAAGAALDTATTTWDTLGQSMVAAGTNTVANEAPIDATYAQALQAFAGAVQAIQFPSGAANDIHALVDAAGAVRTDLGGVASGAVSTTQFVSDESNLQATINLVQRDLGLASSTPIAGG